MTKHVMVIEDEPGILRLLQHMLADEGYTCSVFTNAEGAMQALKRGRERPQVALVDLMLPGASGDRFCREVERLGLDVPCVIMSAGTRAPGVAAELGLRLLQKPFELDDLLAAVEEPTLSPA